MNSFLSVHHLALAWPFQHFRCCDSLTLQGRQAAGKYTLSDQGHRLPQVERGDRSPLAGALLSGGVENLVHHRLAVFILLGEDGGGDVDQEAIQLALVPLRKNFGKFIGGEPQPILQQLVGLADQLHVAVLDAVVHHLYVVPGAVFADPVAAGSSILDFGRDGLENLLHMRPRFFISSRHDRRAEARTFFSARNARPDKQNAFCGQVFGSPGGVGVQASCHHR